MVFVDKIVVCEKCEHRLVRVKSYLTRGGACRWRTEYGCGMIDLKPIRKRIVPPGTDAKKDLSGLLVRSKRYHLLLTALSPCRGYSTCHSPAPLGGPRARFCSRN